MVSLCRMCSEQAELVTSLLDTSQLHLQWAINHFDIELDGVLPTLVCVDCDEIIRQWTLFLSKQEQAILLFSTMIANIQSIRHQSTSNTSVLGKSTTTVCSTTIIHQASNNVLQRPSEVCISDNSSIATQIVAICNSDIKNELVLDECEISLEDPSKNHDADKQPSIKIESPTSPASSSLPSTGSLQLTQVTRQPTLPNSNTSLTARPSFSYSSFSLSDQNLLQILIKKYHIKELTIRVIRLSDHVTDSLLINGTVDCNVVGNQKTERRNRRIKLEPVTVDQCVCNDQVSDNLQQNVSSTMDDDIEVPFEAICDPIVKCEPDLVKAETDSDVQPYLPELELLPETSNPRSNKEVYTSPSVYSCSHCNWTTYCKIKITSHILYKHVKMSRFQCQECNKSFQYKKYLLKHNSYVHPNKCRYKCLLCKRGFQLEQYFNAHIKNHDNILQCDVCGKIFSSKRALVEHKMRIHTKSFSLSCKMCNKIFYTDRSKKLHTRAVHSNLSFKCDVCDKSFKIKSHLCKHQREVHSSVRSFSCNQCGKKFVSKCALKQHSIVHSDLRPFECEKCGSCFSRRAHLTRHIRTVHSKLRPFK